jgi:hypothetical protein
MIRGAALLIAVQAVLAVAVWEAAADPVVADGTWRLMPGTGRALSQPVGIFIPPGKNTQYANSVGVVIRGADQGVYYQNYSLTSESWSGQWRSLGAQTSAAPFTFVGDAWDLLVKDAKSGRRLHAINWSNGWTPWVPEGSGELPWGSPTVAVDGRGRLWTFRRGPNDSVEYRCTPPRHSAPTPAAPRHLLAFYYPWYGTPSGPSRAWVHWDPAKPNYTNRPALGLYDSKDPRVIRQHIEWALTAGINGFISSWWGENSFEDQALREVLKVAEPMGFQVAVYYETAANKEQVLRDFRYLVDRYGSSPAFLKWQGKPVIFVYGRVTGEQMPLLDWGWVFDRLKSEGKEAVFIGDGLREELAYFFDGIHTYNVADQSVARVKTQYRAAASLAKKQGRLFAATVIPGYDDTVIRKPGLKADRRGGALYRDLWQIALDARADWVLVTSFNEWHEGSEIEPSQEYGDQYLSLTAQFARVFKQDLVPPTVAITSPAAGAALSGTVLVTVQASDNGEIGLVRYLVDGRVQATTAARPFFFSWNTTNLPIGPHTLTVQAFDRAGNSESVAIPVTLRPR